MGALIFVVHVYACRVFFMFNRILSKLRTVVMLINFCSTVCEKENLKTFEDFETSPRPQTYQNEQIFTSEPGKPTRVDLSLKEERLFEPYALELKLINVETITVRFVYEDKTKVDLVRAIGLKRFRIDCSV